MVLRDIRRKRKARGRRVGEGGENYVQVIAPNLPPSITILVLLRRVRPEEDESPGGVGSRQGRSGRKSRSNFDVLVGSCGHTPVYMRKDDGRDSESRGASIRRSTILPWLDACRQRWCPWACSVKLGVLGHGSSESTICLGSDDASLSHAADVRFESDRA